MSREMDTTSTITPGVRDPASTPDTAAAHSQRTLPTVQTREPTRPEVWAPPRRFRTRWSEPPQTAPGLLSAS
jgi:hypothetical protein